MVIRIVPQQYDQLLDSVVNAMMSELHSDYTSMNRTETKFTSDREAILTWLKAGGAQSQEPHPVINGKSLYKALSDAINNRNTEPVGKYKLYDRIISDQKFIALLSTEMVHSLPQLPDPASAASATNPADAPTRSQTSAHLQSLADILSAATNDYLTNNNLAAYLKHLEDLLDRNYSSAREVRRLAMPALTHEQVAKIRRIYRNLSEGDRDSLAQALGEKNPAGVKAMGDLLNSDKSDAKVAKQLNRLLQTGILPGNTKRLIDEFNKRSNENPTPPLTGRVWRRPQDTNSADSSARIPAPGSILTNRAGDPAPSKKPSAAPKPTGSPLSIAISQQDASSGLRADASTETGATIKIDDKKTDTTKPDDDKKSPNLLIEHTPQPKADKPTSSPGNTITTNIKHGDHGDFLAFSLLMMVFSAAGGAPLMAGAFLASTLVYSAYASTQVDVSRIRTPNTSEETPNPNAKSRAR